MNSRVGFVLQRRWSAYAAGSNVLLLGPSFILLYRSSEQAAGSFCLLEPSGRARVGSGVTPSVSALGILVLGFLSAPRTLNGVAMADRPHYHPHAPLLLTANLVFFIFIFALFC